MARTPTVKKNPLAWLTEKPFAHRGLHDEPNGIIENTVPAFDRAIDKGNGVEIDIQASFDGHAMVFHDETLERLTELDGPINAYGSIKLRDTKIIGTEQTIPALEQVLDHIGGRIAILLNANRPEGEIHPLCFGIRRALEGYRGPVGVMSADPDIISWFARNAPKIWRGLILSDTAGDRKPGLIQRLGWGRLFSIWRAKPHFIAYDVRSLPSNLSRKLRDSGIPVLAWTVRSDDELVIASDHADNIIYENGYTYADSSSAESGDANSGPAATA
jgi:glycerophosphoryl diester phosphodiesterase